MKNYDCGELIFFLLLQIPICMCENDDDDDDATVNHGV